MTFKIAVSNSAADGCRLLRMTVSAVFFYLNIQYFLYPYQSDAIFLAYLVFHFFPKKRIMRTMPIGAIVFNCCVYFRNVNIEFHLVIKYGLVAVDCIGKRLLDVVENCLLRERCLCHPRTNRTSLMPYSTIADRLHPFMPATTFPPYLFITFVDNFTW